MILAGMVINLLQKHREQWLSMDALTAALQAAPEQIVAAIDELRQMGHIIEALPAYGYRWSRCQEQLNSDLIQCGLTSKRIGREVLVFDSTDSTNNIAWHYANAAGYDGLVVLAEHQHAGRGRLGRVWRDQRGQSVLCSVLLQNVKVTTPAGLTLLAGVSVAQAIEAGAALRPRIKWPNDIYIDGRKVAGLMIEQRQYGDSIAVVIGIGINVTQQTNDFPADLRSLATSLQQHCAQPIERVILIQKLLCCLDIWLERRLRGEEAALQEQWLQRCDDLNRRLTLIQDGRRFVGRVLDVDPEKGLLLNLDAGGVKAFDAATTSVEK